MSAKILDLRKCKVGDVVKFGDGWTAEIVEIRPTSVYPIRCSNDEIYTYEGQYNLTKRDVDKDIVSVQRKSKSEPKKPASVKDALPTDTFDIAGLVGKTLVIDTMTNSGTFRLTDARVEGVFKNEGEAIKHICESAADTFEGDSDGSLEDLENWANDVLIVEVKRVVRPVPRVSVKCEIKEIAGGAK